MRRKEAGGRGGGGIPKQLTFDGEKIVEGKYQTINFCWTKKKPSVYSVNKQRKILRSGGESLKKKMAIKNTMVRLQEEAYKYVAWSTEGGLTK